MSSKLDGLTPFLAPLLPAPRPVMCVSSDHAATMGTVAGELMLFASLPSYGRPLSTRLGVGEAELPVDPATAGRFLAKCGAGRRPGPPPVAGRHRRRSEPQWWLRPFFRLDAVTPSSPRPHTATRGRWRMAPSLPGSSSGTGATNRSARQRKTSTSAPARTTDGTPLPVPTVPPASMSAAVPAAAGPFARPSFAFWPLVPRTRGPSEMLPAPPCSPATRTGISSRCGPWPMRPATPVRPRPGRGSGLAPACYMCRGLPGWSGSMRSAYSACSLMKSATNVQ